MTADGTGLASHAGSLLLAEMADRSGLTAGLSEAMAHTRLRVCRHDPGTVLAHLAVMLAHGGDCTSDLAVLRNQPGFVRTGFHPLLCVLDETGEALAVINRPGNAGANDAADHLSVLDAALAQLPVKPGPGGVGHRRLAMAVELRTQTRDALWSTLAQPAPTP